MKRSPLTETRTTITLAEYVARVVAAAPPLTDEQSGKIAALLRPAGGAA